jgi:anthranilate phosphoribosyltransferase
MELGVNIEASVATVERCLDEIGICFCFAPSLHPAMRHVAAARKALGVPTIFNLLGPLCNPASAPFQLLGVGKPALRRKMAAALALLEPQRAVVVSGEDGLDEVTLTGVTHVTLITRHHRQELTWKPADFGIQENDLSSMIIDGPQASAAIIRDVLAGRSGPPRDIVVLNAAAALWTAGASESLEECTRRAQKAIDDGSARELLQRLAEVSRS